MNPYKRLVTETGRLIEQGKTFPLGTFQPDQRPKPRPDAPKALIFSPHPDDEVIIGGLPLRLLRELQINVLNVAVTQGSNKARQAERWKELSRCCDYIGFGLIRAADNGLEGINTKTRSEKPSHWAASVDRIAEILNEHRPRIIFFPHDDDWNSTHIGTHYLIIDALQKLGAALECDLIETEFWGAMDRPNLLVESSEQDLIDLITALSFHVGEVRRNPYHLRLPAWMIDNVRRGGELVGGQGGAAPDFLFATLYRLRRWQNGAVAQILPVGRFLSRNDHLKTLFSR